MTDSLFSVDEIEDVILSALGRDAVSVLVADGRIAWIEPKALMAHLDARQLSAARRDMWRAAAGMLVLHAASRTPSLGFSGPDAAQRVLDDLADEVVVTLASNGAGRILVDMEPRRPEAPLGPIRIQASEIRGEPRRDDEAGFQDRVDVLCVEGGPGAGEATLVHEPILTAPPCAAKRRGRFSFERVIASLLLLSSLGGAFVSAPALQSGHVLSGALILLASAYASGAALWIAASRPSVCDAQAPLGLCQDLASQRPTHPCPLGAP